MSEKKTPWAKAAAKKTRKPRVSLVEDMRRKLFNEPTLLPTIAHNCIMIYGQDGTGKTGLALSILTKEDVEAGKKIVIVDLDAGNLPIMLKHHRDKVEAGAMAYEDPMRWTEDNEGKPLLDYQATFDNINAIALAALQEHEEKGNIKAIILDGGSKFLKYAEQEMRALKELDPSEGADWNFWKIRNKIFLETLELYKSLPFDSYFIFHEDFLPIPKEPGKKVSSVILQTNQMMYSKIFTERRDLGPKVEYKATIHKSKFDLGMEGRSVVFATVDKKTGEYLWQPEKVMEMVQDVR
jgi:hypothetical protein